MSRRWKQAICPHGRLLNWEEHGSLLTHRLWYLVWLLFSSIVSFDKKLARAPQARQKLDHDSRYLVWHMMDTAQAGSMIMSKPSFLFDRASSVDLGWLRICFCMLYVTGDPEVRGRFTGWSNLAICW